jgi:hypothetical protein
MAFELQKHQTNQQLSGKEREIFVMQVAICFKGPAAMVNCKET